MSDSDWVSLADPSGFIGTDALTHAELGRQEQEWRQLRAANWPPPEPPVQLRIDLNARTGEGHTPAQYHDPERPLRRGSHVIVYEPEDGVATTATVMRVYGDWVHLDVDWDEMLDAGSEGDAPLRPDVLATLWHRIAEWEGP